MDLIICDVCGQTVEVPQNMDVCYSCAGHKEKKETKKPKKTTVRSASKLKALKGTAKQKAWAEAIRKDKFADFTEQQKEDFNIANTIPTYAAFWIANRDIISSKFDYNLLCTERAELAELEAKHYDFLARTNPTGEKNRRKQEIIDFIKSCTFKHESALV
jgi:hypothetical protein